MPAYRPRHARRNLAPHVLKIALPLLLVLFVAYLFLEPSLIQVEKTTLELPALSSDVGQLRVVYVSDIHQGQWPYFTQQDVASLAARINAQRADLVLLGGDYAMDSESAIQFFKDLPPIRANYGVWGVLGECDRTLPESNLARLRTAMITAGVTPIVNEVTSLRVGTQTIYLAGVDDVTNGAPELAEVAAQCRSTDLVIFLCHNPEIIPSALDAFSQDGRKGWFDLGLFGHTHGGQLALFGKLLGTDHTAGDYQRGWYRPNRVPLLVSRGIGETRVPLRFGRTPQIHLITLKSGAK